ncbi:MAG: hypothetical protein JST00_22515 [Deltaproteobacteria bacterium]|nr:hypothetical protein [Deltaproteobacteria bacterium]
MRLDEGFDARATRTFERLFGAALLAEIATQMASGVWRVHAGESYPWRHLGIIPLAPPSLLALEWALVALAASAIVVAPAHLRRLAWRALPPLLLWGVLQRFSNHGSLFFMVSLFVAMAPPRVDRREAFEAEEHPNLGLVRAQIVVVYGFSAVAKLLHGFTSGASLVNLLGVAPSLAKAMSWGVIGVELALAALVMTRPRLALAGAVLLHASFALVLPNVLSFGVCMVSMAALWWRRAPAER